MSLTSKKVYIATSVLLAFIDRSHPKHEQAAAYFRYFATEGYHIFTDIVTITETHRQIAEEMSPTISKEFLKTIMQSSITILYPDDRDTESAMKLYIGDRTSELTFQTALLAVIADKKEIPQIATFEYLHAVFGLRIFMLPM
jgi:predicted nucleic acid-binding protein